MGAGEANTSALHIELETRVLAKNDGLAELNRLWFAKHRILCVNLVGGPGAGKTSILERTIRSHDDKSTIYVLEGDQSTSRDADRIRTAGAKAVQINTGAGCHLDADMVGRGVRALRPAARSVLFVENVGNLVCPALFDLGEQFRVVVLSVTEGDDKPLKYPHIFQTADLVLINKIDLLPFVEFDLTSAVENARQVNQNTKFITLSARTGDGFDEWYRWIRDREAVTEDLESFHF